MNWYLKSFSELATTELYELLQLRAAVFVVEQNCAYQDLDDKDRVALHLFGRDQQGGIAAYCRLLPPGISYPEASIGRVACAEYARGKGLGRVLMQMAIEKTLNHWPGQAIHISAQHYLEGFYRSLGFETVTDIYQEDGIDHIGMLRYGPPGY
jgi:ElaA protein